MVICVMKKVLLVSLCAAAVFVSCQMKEQTVQENELLIYKTFTVAMPDSSTEPNSKTYLNTSDLAVYWAAGDEINVIARTTGNQYTFTIKDGEEGSASATFEGEILAADAEETEFYAVYPNVNVVINKGASIAEDVIEYLGSASGDHIKYFNKDTDPVKAIVNGFDSRYAPMTAVLSGGVFAFRHGAAYFKLTMGVDDVQKVKLTASESARFNGRPKYNYDGSTNTVESAKAYIYSQPEAGTFVKGGTYYIPVLTKQSSVGNLTITYTLSDGTTESSVTTSSLSSTKLVSGKIYDLKTPPIVFTPEISSSNLTIEAGDTGGTINFTVSNLVTGAYVAKSITSDGLDNSSWGDISYNSSTGVGSLTFTCDENTDPDDPKTATVHLLYTTDGSTELAYANVTVTQKKAGAAVTYTWGFTSTNTSDTVANTTYSWSSDTVGQAISYDGKSSDSIIEYPSKSGVYCLKMNGDSSSGSRRYFTYSAPTAGTLIITGYQQGSADASLTVKLGSDTVSADAGSPTAFASSETECTYTITTAGTVTFYTTGKSYFKSVVFTY